MGSAHTTAAFITIFGAPSVNLSGSGKEMRRCWSLMGSHKKTSRCTQLRKKASPLQAASKNPAQAGETLRRAETGSRDAVRWIQRGREDTRLTLLLHKEAKKWNFPVMVAEEVDEASITDYAAPTLAYGGSEREGGRLWWEADKDLSSSSGCCRAAGGGNEPRRRIIRARVGQIGRAHV